VPEWLSAAVTRAGDADHQLFRKLRDFFTGRGIAKDGDDFIGIFHHAIGNAELDRLRKAAGSKEFCDSRRNR